ncbi:MAG TPA: molybdopterin-dependent oxidoreductase, partial [Candidatus Thermoplasmatota archaeon]|nr:molybdopterin-dependent oxidoreductase [Candidatus Thermoplasmatota archaeon]
RGARGIAKRFPGADGPSEPVGGKLIVVDPRPIPLARLAWLHLQPNPGTDVALYNGMLREILARGLADVEFVRDHAEGFDELRRAVEPYDLARVERITGVPQEKIVQAAVAYGSARRAAIYWGMGVSQHTTGSDNSFCLINLALVTGNVGRRGTGLNPLRGQNNVQGASDMGSIPMYYPGYQRADDPAVRLKFGEAWGVGEGPPRGLTVTEILKAAERREIRGLYVMGENPVLSDPDMNHVDRCVAALDFLAVQDIFLTETAEYADVVLPAATGLEKEGTYANTDRHVQMGRAVLAPPGEAREDWRIVQDLAQRMGYPMDYPNVAAIQEEVRSLVPDYAGITHGRIARENVQWPARSTDEPGMAIYESIPRGKGLLRPAEWLPARELPDAEFPYVLNTGRVLEHWHTGTMTRRARVLDELSPDPFVEMNEDDALREGLRDGERVRVASRRGSVELRLKATRRMLRNTVFIPFHFREAAANLLTIDALDPYAKIPEFKFCAVRIEPLGPPKT